MRRQDMEDVIGHWRAGVADALGSLEDFYGADESIGEARRKLRTVEAEMCDFIMGRPVDR